MELHPVDATRVPVTEIVKRHPASRTLALQQRANGFLRLHIGLVEQPAEALSNQRVAGAEDVQRGEKRRDRVPPFPAGHHDQPEGDKHRRARPHIGQHMQSVGANEWRLTAFPHADQCQPEDNVHHHRHSGHDGTEDDVVNLNSEDALPHRFINDQQRGSGNHRTLETGRQERDLVVAEVVGFIRRLVSQAQCPDRKCHRQHVDD